MKKTMTVAMLVEVEFDPSDEFPELQARHTACRKVFKNLIAGARASAFGPFSATILQTGWQEHAPNTPFFAE